MASWACSRAISALRDTQERTEGVDGRFVGRDSGRMGYVEKLNRQESLANRALDLIRNEIVTGVTPPGTVLSANSLAERFGVSRTPVRDALLQLAQAGMVRMEKNRGAVVLATSLEDLVEVYQLRLMLEVPLAAQAARVRSAEQMREIRDCHNAMRAAAGADLLVLDRDLHLAIARAAGNTRARAMLADLRNLVLTRGVSTTASSRSPQELIDDHVDFVEAIDAQDPVRAAQGMARHLMNTAKLLIAQESRQDPRFDAEWVESRLAWTMP